ncbi:hypothetical protein ACVW0W_006595 [Bradyrhizobium sp. USDA 4469]
MQREPDARQTQNALALATNANAFALATNANAFALATNANAFAPISTAEEQPQQNDHRDRHTQQPQQNSASHRVLLQFVLSEGQRRPRELVPAIWTYQWPVFGIDAHGSAGAFGSPFCSSSIECRSGERTKAMLPSRGGRLMVTPAFCSFSQVA